MYYQAVDPAIKAKEKAKARKLKNSQWWKQELAKGTCYYCSQSFPKELLTMDHKVPVARGGKTSKSNVVVACKSCNTNKAHLTPAEFVIQAEQNQSSPQA